MKRVAIMLPVAGMFLAGAVSVSTNSSAQTVDILVQKHDLNRNGKIDVNERKPYVRELSRQRREDAKTLAAQRPVLGEHERLFYRPPRLSPELVRRYDTNHNGTLDVPEQLAVQTAFAETAKQEFRRYDVNNDGKLDMAELKTMREARRAEAPRQAVASPATNAPVSSPTTQPIPRTPPD